MIWLAIALLAIVIVNARTTNHARPTAFSAETPINWLNHSKRLAANAFPQTKQVPQNNLTLPFIVQGTQLPDVDFDIGESYAGILPITAKNESWLYFWYFPTTTPSATDDLTIWLNGGPGCSSLVGILQEHGNFMWKAGTYKPVKNPWAWRTLTNIVYVEQPVGTGFSGGKQMEVNSELVAKSFLSWFKNFVDTFGLQGKKIYLAGESYAGVYIPYIADAMFNAKDKKHFDLRGTLIYDGVLNTDLVSSEVGAAAYAKEYNVVFRLNKTTMANIENVAKTCKFTDYLKKHLQYPPRGIIPQPKIDKNSVSKCTTISETIMKATKSTNPCFNQYNILGTCPLLWDVLGSPGTIDYTPSSATVYFNRVDVKKAINAPQGIYWSLCRSVPLGQNPAAESEPTSFKLLPRVIERSERTILGHGSLDFVILSSATLLSIQNMTWNGKQGFQSQPSNEFFVPDYASEDLDSLAGKGVLGVTHTERGLTYVEIFQSGHMVPENSPSAAYRHLEFLLGRVKSLSDRSPYTVAPVSYPF